MNHVTVSIPATTANLGPGFDTLGMALGLYNEVRFTAVESGLQFVVSGEGADRLPADHRNLVYRAAQAVFAIVGRRPAGLRIEQDNKIPVGSGMGSSASAVVGGLLAANALIEGGLSREELLRIAVGMEGHPDNVTPALYGGLTLVNTLRDGALHVTHLALPPLQATLVLPRYQLLTSEARAALPTHVSMGDAVFNIGRVALLVHALTHADYDALGIAMDDQLHQPYRQKLVPGMADALRAARAAGAAGAAISGAGPSVIAFAPDHQEEIAAAMVAAFGAVNLTCRVWTLGVNQDGAAVTTA